jgi:Tfp pilus assembly protein PilN
MRAVNLIPGESARRSAAEGSGAAVYVVLAALAALVVLASLWSVANKQTGERRARLDRANAAATAAEARADAAGPYQDFARLAQDRVATIGALASTRFDWSHAMREIGRVLPADVWLTELSGSSGADGSAPTPTASSAPAPTFTLNGCTGSQGKVALLMARLRAIDGVREVDLSKSEKPDSAGDTSCPAHQDSDPRFEIAISFAVPAAPKDALDATGQVTAPAVAPAAAAAAPAAAAPSASGATSSSSAASTPAPASNVQ